MKVAYSTVGLGQLCGLFGKTRQAYYKRIHAQEERAFQQEIILHWVAQIRQTLPRLGGKKLYHLLQEKIRTHCFRCGRDKLFDLLREKNLLIRPRRKYARTTDSRHHFHCWPNLVEGLEVEAAEQLWVCDITYLSLGQGKFVYLALVTDAYSRKIMGFHLSNRLKATMCLAALRMAVRTREYPERVLIHHSDRGVQYCSSQYVEALQKADIQISMTQSGSPYENPIAERVNGILKQELGLDQTFDNYQHALAQVVSAIETYNHRRPHASCNYMIPSQAHWQIGALPKRW
jgi:transposase InsO family protein